jgi:hypothetical protein
VDCHSYRSQPKAPPEETKDEGKPTCVHNVALLEGCDICALEMGPDTRKVNEAVVLQLEVAEIVTNSLRLLCPPKVPELPIPDLSKPIPPGWWAPMGCVVAIDGTLPCLSCREGKQVLLQLGPYFNKEEEGQPFPRLSVCRACLLRGISVLDGAQKHIDEMAQDSKKPTQDSN